MIYFTNKKLSRSNPGFWALQLLSGEGGPDTVDHTGAARAVIEPSETLYLPKPPSSARWHDVCVCSRVRVALGAARLSRVWRSSAFSAFSAFSALSAQARAGFRGRAGKAERADAAGGNSRRRDGHFADTPLHPY